MIDISDYCDGPRDGGIGLIPCLIFILFVVVLCAIAQFCSEWHSPVKTYIGIVVWIVLLIIAACTGCAFSA